MAGSSIPKPILAVLISALEAVLSFPLVQKRAQGTSLSFSFACFAGLNFGLLLTYKVFIYPYFLSPLRHLPRPKGEIPLLGQGLRPFKRPIGDWQLQIMTEVPNDGLITFRGLFNRERLVVTHPRAVAEIFVHKSYDFEKPPEVRTFLTKFLGNGLIVTEGEDHKFQRKHVMPAFSFRHIKELYPVFWTKALQLCERVAAEIREAPAPWTEEEEEGGEGVEKSEAGTEKGLCGLVEMNHWANKATLDIIGLAGLGRDFNALQDASDDLVDTYEEILEPTTEKQLLFGVNMILPQSLVEKLPWKLNDRVRATTGYLREACLKLVRDGRELCKTQGVQQKDILSLLIKSDNFSDDQLVDQLLTFLAAGHETTSSAYSWTCYLLAEHQDIQTRLRAELDAALPLSSTPSASSTTTTTSPPTLATPPDIGTTLESLNYLNAICNEVLRFYPTVPLTARVCTTATTILGTQIPVGTHLLVCPWAINRNPHLWGPDAGTFNPDRWLDPDTGKVNNEGGVNSNYANMTFVHGPRSCIGQGFAKAELRALVAATVSRFEFVMQRPGEKVVPGGVITTKPRGGVHMKLRKREGW